MAVDSLLTPAEISERLKVTERTITGWLRQGRLRGFKIGKEWRVSERDFEAFLEGKANLPPLPDGER